MGHSRRAALWPKSTGCDELAYVLTSIVCTASRRRRRENTDIMNRFVLLRLCFRQTAAERSRVHPSIPPAKAHQREAPGLRASMLSLAALKNEPGAFYQLAARNAVGSHVGALLLRALTCCTSLLEPGRFGVGAS